MGHISIKVNEVYSFSYFYCNYSEFKFQKLLQIEQSKIYLPEDSKTQPTHVCILCIFLILSPILLR